MLLFIKKCLHHPTAPLERINTPQNSIFKFFVNCYYTLVLLILSEAQFVELVIVLVSNPYIKNS